MGVYTDSIPGDVAQWNCDEEWNYVDGTTFSAGDGGIFALETSYGVDINSDSIIGYYEVLRKIGAAARYMLIEAAAKNMNTAKEDLIIEKSIIFDKNTGENRSFGELVDIAASLDLPTDFPL